jgi:NAD(P)H-nitrite reductase large subunit
LADIGVIGTRDGVEVFAGGKGGAAPIVGRRIARGVALGEMIRIIEALVAFHQHKGVPDQRIAELMDDPEFTLSPC